MVLGFHVAWHYLASAVSNIHSVLGLHMEQRLRVLALGQDHWFLRLFPATLDLSLSPCNLRESISCTAFPLVNICPRRESFALPWHLGGS
jgi:hypothetical protein